MSKLPILCGDRESAPRPCQRTECRYNLCAPKDPRGRKSTVVRDDGETCALDVAELGAHTLDEIGAIVGLTRERVRQIEVRAMLKLRVAARKLDLDLSDIVPRTEHPLDLSPSPKSERREKVREWTRLRMARVLKQAGNA
jgi:hypothetical protein